MQKMKSNGIIAFCGSKFSGKSTSAILFKDLLSAPTEEVAIAGHLKEATSRVFKIDMILFLDPKLKEIEVDELLVLTKENLEAIMKEFDVENYSYNEHIRPHVGRILKTPRSLLQYLGTEVLHAIDPLIHVKKALKKKDATKMTIITDLRFVAEFEYLTQGINFLPVYVKNASAELRASTDSHPSERQFELFKNKCQLLNNEGSLQDLNDNLKELMERTYE